LSFFAYGLPPNFLLRTARSIYHYHGDIKAVPVFALGSQPQALYPAKKRRESSYHGLATHQGQDDGAVLFFALGSQLQALYPAKKRRESSYHGPATHQGQDDRAVLFFALGSQLQALYPAKKRRERVRVLTKVSYHYTVEPCLSSAGPKDLNLVLIGLMVIKPSFGGENSS